MVTQGLSSKPESKKNTKISNSHHQIAQKVIFLNFSIRSNFQPKVAQDYLEVETFGLKPNSDEYIAQSDLLIGHCGAGTLLDSIKKGTLAIAVNNELMMHNHQRELLDELKELKHIAGIEHSQLVTAEKVSSILSQK